MDDPGHLAHGLEGRAHEVLEWQGVHQPGLVVGRDLHQREHAVVHAGEAALDVHGQQTGRMPQGQGFLQFLGRVHVGRGEVKVVEHHLTSVP